MALSMRRRKVDGIINSMEEEDILKWKDELRGREAGIDDDYIVKLVGEGDEFEESGSSDEENQVTEEVDPDEIISSITPVFTAKGPKPPPKPQQK